MTIFSRTGLQRFGAEGWGLTIARREEKWVGCNPVLRGSEGLDEGEEVGHVLG
jgi:hypothetical protein